MRSTAQECNTGDNTIFGNDIYGAANNNGNKTNNPFYNNPWWWLASPSSNVSYFVCYVDGYRSNLYISLPYDFLQRGFVVRQCCVVVCGVWLS